jgi:hypothetical protein
MTVAASRSCRITVIIYKNTWHHIIMIYTAIRTSDLIQRLCIFIFRVCFCVQTNICSSEGLFFSMAV